MESRVADDLLWGVEAIAKEIGQPVRQVYWRLEQGQLPAGKSGNIWVASRQNLRTFFKELTASMTAAAQAKEAKKVTKGVKKAAASG
jgi:hypothetical protein